MFQTHKGRDVLSQNWATGKVSFVHQWLKKMIWGLGIDSKLLKECGVPKKKQQ